MSEKDFPLFCARCLMRLTPGTGSFYVVQINAVADPTPPEISPADLRRDARREINQLIEELSKYSEQELIDQVFRRVTIHLCNRCFRTWIENPAGCQR